MLNALEVTRTNWDWWLTYGFDGIVGGLVGGIATGVAVWLTIRHERRLSDRRETRAAVARCVSTLTLAQFEVVRNTRATQNASFAEVVNTVFAELRLAASLVAIETPGLSQDFSALGIDLQNKLTQIRAAAGSRSVRADAVLHILRSAVARGETWLEYPDRYDKDTTRIPKQELIDPASLDDETVTTDPPA